MRNQLSIAALIALSAATGAAFAATPVSYGQGAGSESTAFVSTASRAEVKAEAVNSVGQIRHGQAGGTEQTAFVSTRSRADVMAETRQALRNGEILNGLGAGSRSAKAETVLHIAGQRELPSAL